MVYVMYMRTFLIPWSPKRISQNLLQTVRWINRFGQEKLNWSVGLGSMKDSLFQTKIKSQVIYTIM